MTTDLHVEAIERECGHLRHINAEIRLSGMYLNKAAFDEDDERVKVYIGLPSDVTLMTVFTFVSAHLPLLL